jgi:hypothetical protein
MSRLSLIALPAVLAAASLPAAAQSFRVTPTVRPPQIGVVGQHFIPGFGFRPIIRERFPVFGIGFDAHHHHVLRGPRFFQPGFGGGFFGGNFFAGGFIPLATATSSSVVVVQQPTPIVLTTAAPADDPPVAVAAGLPENWDRVRLVRSSYPPEPATPPQLTLLVLGDETIFAVRQYWLEDGRLYYVTSTGRQGSVDLKQLDWDMTVRLNAERNVEFVLRSEP